jgi:hypothetical protein
MIIIDDFGPDIGELHCKCVPPCFIDKESGLFSCKFQPSSIDSKSHTKETLYFMNLWLDHFDEIVKKLKQKEDD